MLRNIKHVVCFFCLLFNMSEISAFNLMLNRRAFLANSLLIPARKSIVMNNSILRDTPSIENSKNF